MNPVRDKNSESSGSSVKSVSNGMNVKYIDTHCHLQFEQYDVDRDDVIEKMREEGVEGIVVGCDFASSKKAVELAEKYEHLYASIGLHPNHEDGELFEIEQYRTLAENPKVVAIGECGLDYFRIPFVASAENGPTDVTKEVQEEQKTLFKKHIELSVFAHKPLIIHCRPTKGTQDSYTDLIEILTQAKKEHPDLRGDIHFFVGGITEAEAFNVLDFTVSFTAVITFTHEYDEVVKTVPLKNILSETDAPYVAPASRRGKRNDPLAVIDVVDRIASLRGENADKVRAELLKNARRLFGIS